VTRCRDGCPTLASPPVPRAGPAIITPSLLHPDPDPVPSVLGLLDQGPDPLVRGISVSAKKLELGIRIRIRILILTLIPTLQILPSSHHCVSAKNSVGDPDPHPDPLRILIRIRIRIRTQILIRIQTMTRRIRMFLGLPDPHPDPLIGGTYLDPDPDPSMINQKE
jgi:hypothetical protein